MQAHALRSNMLVTRQSEIGEYGYCKLCNADMQSFVSDGKVRHYKSHRYYRARFGNFRRESK